MKIFGTDLWKYFYLALPFSVVVFFGILFSQVSNLSSETPLWSIGVLLFLFIALCPAGWLAYKRFGSLKEVAVVSALLIVLFFPAATAGQWLGGELRAYTPSELGSKYSGFGVLFAFIGFPVFVGAAMAFLFSWKPAQKIRETVSPLVSVISRLFGNTNNFLIVVSLVFIALTISSWVSLPRLTSVGFRIEDTAGNPVNGASVYLSVFEAYTTHYLNQIEDSPSPEVVFANVPANRNANVFVEKEGFEHFSKIVWTGEAKEPGAEVNSFRVLELVPVTGKTN